MTYQPSHYNIRPLAEPILVRLDGRMIEHEFGVYCAASGDLAVAYPTRSAAERFVRQRRGRQTCVLCRPASERKIVG